MQKKLLLFPLFVLVVLSITSCATTTVPTDSLSYDDFDFIESYDEIWNRSEGTYLVYLYSTSCVNCIEIKSTVLHFAATYSLHNIYFYNVFGNIDTQAKADYLAKVGDPEVYIPALIVVIDNDFDVSQTSTIFYKGRTDIPEVMEKLLNGTFSF